MKQALGQSPSNRSLALAGVVLQNDEHVIAQSVIHDAIFWKSVVVIVLGMLVLPTFATTLGVFLMFVGVIMLVIAYMTRRFLIVIATDKRIIIRSGILYADMIEMRYTQVESVEIGITPIGQIFGYGSVILTGTGNRRIIVPFIANALDFKAKVNEILVNK